MQMLSLTQHRSTLDIYNDPAEIRKTSIICTIGPSTNSVEMINQLRKEGMSIVRMNFSHGTHKFHKSIIENTRKSVEEVPMLGKQTAIALDTKGPEIRTGMVADGEVELELDSEVIISVDSADFKKCSSKLIYVDYENLPKVVEVGGSIFIDDGLISLEILSIDGKQLRTKVMNSGTLSSQKGVNLPRAKVDLPALSDKDKEDLKFGVENDIDIVFVSFVRKGSDIQEVRDCLGEKGQFIKIIAKIENHEGLNNFDEILEAADGVMVARGDMGTEIEPQKVFLAQKMIISKCNLAGKPVICATQMLESMTKNPRPTRAETSDVANAVLDGADCVMLSGETAKGKYPVETVRIMSRICREAENVVHYKQQMNDLITHAPSPTMPSETVAMSAVLCTQHQNCSAILTLTNSGESARLLSKYRPQCPILVLSRNPRACRQAHLYRGCYPVEYPHKEMGDDWVKDVETRIKFAILAAKGQGLVKNGQSILIVRGAKLNGVHYSLCHFSVHMIEQD